MENETYLSELPAALVKAVDKLTSTAIHVSTSTIDNVVHYFESNEFFLYPEEKPKCYILDLNTLSEGLSYELPNRTGTVLTRVSGTGTRYRSVSERPKFKDAIPEGYLYFISYSTISDVIIDGKASLSKRYHLVAESIDPAKPIDIEISIQQFIDKTVICPKRDLNIDPASQKLGNFAEVIKQVIYLITSEARFALEPNDIHNITFNDYYNQRESIFKRSSPTQLTAGGFDTTR